MKTTFRWNRIIILATIPLVLCLALVLFGPGLARSFRQNLWKNDPARAAEIAHSLTDYVLPSGYSETAYLQVKEVSNVIIAPANGAAGMTILFTQEADSLNDQELVSAMEDAWAKEVGAHTYETARSREGATQLRGRDATLSYREGSDETGQPVRQLVTVFYAKTGWAVLVIVSPLASWDQNLVDDFLRSLS